MCMGMDMDARPGCTASASGGLYVCVWARVCGLSIMTRKLESIWLDLQKVLSQSLRRAE